MFKQLPKIDVKPTAQDRLLIRIGWVCFACTAIVILSFYASLPQKIPSNFNFKGEVNAYSDKSTIWVLLVLGVVVYQIILWVIMNMKPWHYNYPTKVTERNAAELYALSIRMQVVLNFIIALSFCFISIAIGYSALHNADLGLWFLPIMLIAIFGSMTYYILQMFKVPKE